MKRFVYFLVLFLFLSNGLSICVDNELFVWNYSLSQSLGGYDGIRIGFGNVSGIYNVSTVLNVSTGVNICVDSSDQRYLIDNDTTRSYWEFNLVSIDSYVNYSVCPAFANITWFNTSFSSRLNFSILTTPEVYDVPVKIVFFREPEMSINVSEMRVTYDLDNQTEEVIDFWLENYTRNAGSNVTVWAEVPVVTADNLTIVYLYFDNSTSVVDDSSIANTFTDYDDFEDCDVSDWGVAWGAPVHTAVINSINEGCSSLLSNPAGGGVNKVFPASTGDVKINARIDADTGNAGNYANIIGENLGGGGNYFFAIRLYHGGFGSRDIHFFNGASIDTGADWILGYNHEFLFDLDWVAKTYDLFLDDVLLLEDIAFVDGVSTDMDRIALAYLRVAGTPQMYNDDILFGNFANITTITSPLGRENFTGGLSNFTTVHVHDSDLEQMNGWYNATTYYEENNTLTGWLVNDGDTLRVTCTDSESNLTFNGNFVEFITSGNPNWVIAEFSSNGQNYFRQVLIGSFSGGLQEIKMFFLDLFDTSKFQVNIQLVTDESEWDNAQIIIRRLYGSGFETIHSGLADVERKVVTHLEQFQTYYLWIYGTEDSRSLGFFIPDEEGTKFIDLRVITYGGNKDSVYKEVFWNITYDEPVISLNFYDEGDTVTNVSWWIFNGTPPATDLVYYLSGSDTQFTWSFNTQVPVAEVPSFVTVVEDFEPGGGVGAWVNFIGSAAGSFTDTNLYPINGSWSGNHSTESAGQRGYRYQLVAPITERFSFKAKVETPNGGGDYTRVDACEDAACTQYVNLVFIYQNTGISTLHAGGLTGIGNYLANTTFEVEVKPWYANNTFDIYLDGVYINNFAFSTGATQVEYFRVNGISSGSNYTCMVDDFWYRTEIIPAYTINYANQTIISGFVAYSSKYGLFGYNTTLFVSESATSFGKSLLPSNLDDFEIERGICLLFSILVLTFTLSTSQIGSLIGYFFIFFFWMQGWLPSVTQLDLSIIGAFAIAGFFIPRKKVNA